MYNKKEKEEKLVADTTKKQQKAKNKTYIVEEETELLAFLINKKIKTSRNATKSVLTRGQVEVEGKTVTQHNYKLKPGEQIKISANKKIQRNSALIGVQVLFEDNDIIIIEKEAGVLSVAAKNTAELTAYQQLSAYVKEENPQNKIFVVHRLDRDTSGVMVFAKNTEAKRTLQDNWKERVKKREYIAVVEGKIKQPEGKIESFLKENKAYKVYSSPRDNGGKKAITNYRLIQKNEQFSLVSVSLETGRKNQIRVHMADIGHPVVGDKKYGAVGNPLKRLGLHAAALAFLHPVTDKLLEFHSTVPKEFKRKTS